MTSQRGASGTPVAPRSRLYLSSLSHLRDVRVRRILKLAGYDLRFGVPGMNDQVAIWGQGRTANRGKWLAAQRGAQLLHLEDGFLRSVRPGRCGDPPLSLIADPGGAYFDANAETNLERLLNSASLEDPTELARAETLIARLTASGVSKYNYATGVDPAAGFVLVVDQTHGDRSVAGANASEKTFLDMLTAARAEHPNRQIVIQQHPETALGLREGYLTKAGDDICAIAPPAQLYNLLSKAHAVYTVSSQIGFEAILSGHRPCVFGQAFYAGWGLSDDRAPHPERRQRKLSRAQLALAVLIKYPLYYDPYRDRLTDPESVIDALEAQSRAFREDVRGSVALGMRVWKRKWIRDFFKAGPVRFVNTRSEAETAATRMGTHILAWGSKGQAKQSNIPATHGVEDGFLRSVGLGASLVPAVSLVRDPVGIYFDPESPSALEELIVQSEHLPPAELARAASLRRRIVETGLTKYNLDRSKPNLSCGAGPQILVIGQVEDDASIIHGATGPVKTNAALLDVARQTRPDAQLIYKPHPDVEAGLRPGTTPTGADIIASGSNPAKILEAVDEVWTITSLMGFEALLRGRKVVTLGLPFYAGWGLTHDLAPQEHTAFARRRAHAVTIDGLVHAALIAYPRYWDPKTSLACPVEVTLERLEARNFAASTPPLKVLSKLQGLLASYSWLWR
ncbi:MAG: capsular polysaccharide biosynthesis protein [Dinoroseobacter sp.]|nr:capsular polysaccharide biosynthesis protein [Dinoroseobacter sp.]